MHCGKSLSYQCKHQAQEQHLAVATFDGVAAVRNCNLHDSHQPKMTQSLCKRDSLIVFKNKHIFIQLAQLQESLHIILHPNTLRPEHKLLLSSMQQNEHIDVFVVYFLFFILVFFKYSMDIIFNLKLNIHVIVFLRGVWLSS